MIRNKWAYSMIVCGAIIAVCSVVYAPGQHKKLPPNTEQIVAAIRAGGGYMLSESKVLYFTTRTMMSNQITNTWFVYDYNSEKTTDGSSVLLTASDVILKLAIDNAEWISGDMEHLVIISRPINGSNMVFEINYIGGVFNIASPPVLFQEGLLPSPSRLVSTKVGWCYTVPHSKTFTAMSKQLGLREIQYPFLNSPDYVSVWPSENAIFVIGVEQTLRTIDLAYIAMPSESLIVSNAFAPPCRYDYVSAWPSPSGEFVVWRFGVKNGPIEKVLKPRLQALFPRLTTAGPEEIKWRFYVSDVTAQKLRILCSFKSADEPWFIWGRSNTILLTDEDYGARSFSLKK